MNYLMKVKKVFVTTPFYCALICFLLALLVSVSVFCPKLYRSAEPSTDYIDKTLTSKDVYLIQNASIDTDGNYVTSGDDPQLIFTDLNENIGTIVINTKEPLNNSIQIFIDSGDGFSEQTSKTVTGFDGENKVCIDTSNTYIKNLRIDIDDNCQIVNILLYNKTPNISVETINIPKINYLYAFLISIVVAAGVFFLDKKIRFSSTLLKKIYSNKIKILLFAGISIILIGIAILIELFINKVFPGFSTYGQGFSKYRLVVIYGILISINAVVFLKNSVAKNPEKLFLALMLIIGTVFIVASPFGHNSWDIDTHYRWALNASYASSTKYYSDTDKAFFYNSPIAQAKKTLTTNIDGKEKANEMDKIITSTSSTQKTTIAHLASGAFIAVARFFGASFTFKFAFGAFANLLTYAIVMYLAMKKLKTGKMILAVFAMLPTNLFIATNYSYDYWVTCFTVLGMAYFLSEVQQPDKPITKKDTIIMFGAFALAAIPKLVYAIFLLIPFFIKKNNFEKVNRKKYNRIGIIIIAILIGMIALTAISKIGGVGDLRGGSTVSPSGQIKYILNNPFEYAKTLIKFLAFYLSITNMSGLISLFPYLGQSDSYIIIIAILLLVVMTDKNEYDLITPRKRMNILTLAIYFCGAALIATSLYIVFTPVGNLGINGCQQRYLTPLIYPVISVIGTPFIVNRIKRQYYNTTILLVMSFILFYDFSSIFLAGRIV